LTLRLPKAGTQMATDEGKSKTCLAAIREESGNGAICSFSLPLSVAICVPALMKAKRKDA
jgi:hypothetical protein